MKIVWVVWAFSFLAVVAASAAPVSAPDPVVGTFRFSGVYRVESIQKNEVVNDSDEAGKRRLERLRREGFGCVHRTRGWYACAKHVPPPSDHEELDARVVSRWRGFELVLERPISDLSLEFDAEFYKQWSARQKALAGGVASYTTKYAWTQGVWKLYLDRGVPGESPMFLLEGGRVSAPDTVTVGSERAWDRFFVVVDLSLSGRWCWYCPADGVGFVPAADSSPVPSGVNPPRLARLFRRGSHRSIQRMARRAVRPHGSCRADWASRERVAPAI
ncbi:MAG: hypothetical protein HUU37_08025 [Bdellovibrionales bacterium]|nr:hypothetical protein [Bdellovibrionales bacterium]